MGYLFGLGAAGATINYAAGVTTKLPDWADEWLRGVMAEANVTTVQVSSTVRSVQDQASIMYSAGKKNGSGYLANLYKTKIGQRVAAIFEFMTVAGSGQSAQQVIAAMAAEIAADPAAVSSHIQDDSGESFTFDLSPNSLGGAGDADNFGSPQYYAMINAIGGRYRHGEVKTFIFPPDDDGIHVKLLREASIAQAVANTLTPDSLNSDGDESALVLPGPAGVPVVAWGLGAVGLVWWLTKGRR